MVHGLEEDKVTHITQKIEQDGGKAFGFVSDLSTDEGAAYIADQAQESLGGVDILINNAGAFDTPAVKTGDSLGRCFSRTSTLPVHYYCSLGDANCP